MKKIILTISVLTVSSFNFAYADCATDLTGTVYCSKYPNGGATTNITREVECGKGQCRTDSVGSVKCSRIEGGGAGVDSIGSVKCLDGCESGSTAMCIQGQ